MKQDPPPSGSTSVIEVVERLRQGPATPSVLRRASRVLTRIEPAARAACRRYAGPVATPARIEELVQDTLETVWRRMSGPDFAVDHFEPWVRGIARKVCANDRRKKRDLLTDDGVLEATDAARDVLFALQRHERDSVLIEAAEEALEGIEQDVVYHRYVDHLDRKKIAELMGLADEDAVRVVLQRATRRLRSALLQRLEELGHGISLVLPDE